MNVKILLSCVILYVKVWALIFCDIFQLLPIVDQKVGQSYILLQYILASFHCQSFHDNIKIYTSNCPWLCLTVKQDVKNIFKNILFI